MYTKIYRDIHKPTKKKQYDIITITLTLSTTKKLPVETTLFKKHITLLNTL